jgi:hypothetical protein
MAEDTKPTAAPVAPAAPVPASAAKRIKKLSKEFNKDNTNLLTITESGTGKVLKFDFKAYPPAIQANFGPFGMGSKLGDAAAGKEGQEAVDAIMKVHDGLMKGDWTVRAPATAKVSTSDVMARYNAMPEGPEKVVAKKFLTSLGLIKA